MPANVTQRRLDFGKAGNWNAIEARARQLVDKWQGETYERGESQSFWSDFLQVFGIDRKRAGAFFEYRTRKLGGAPGYVDLFWPGRLIAEQKSAGRDLNRAMEQALEYLPAMPDHELPRAVVVSDFQTFEIAHLEDSSRNASFTLEQLPDRVRYFDFLFDLDEHSLSEQNPVNIKAAQDISKLHEGLKKQGYRGEDLEIFLTRVVFCLFAEDTGIFARGQFRNYVRNQSRADGYNLGRVLNELFEILNTPVNERMRNTPATLAEFPYVNGGLFEITLRTPQLDADARRAILTASLQDWSEVNPSIFGSMFQGVMDEVERRELGAHYTSEKNILRLIQPLFLDDLYDEFERVRESPGRLKRFHDKIANLKFLDPACGSGNFLVITYRELRRLEHKVLQALHPQGLGQLDPVFVIRCNVEQMAGIELEEFPAKVAELALWLTDHQMNIEAAKLFRGDVSLYMRIPIKTQPNIVQANALRLDWGDVVDLSDLDYIIGNPPFIGKSYQTKEMKAELSGLFKGTSGWGNLDYVTGWYVKSAKAMGINPSIRAALVSTNSIAQGQQVAPLWTALYSYDIQITFAHQTFQWRNDAPGVAAVFCVIIGFRKGKPNGVRRLFTYPSINDEPVESAVSNINAYLVGAPNALVSASRSPLTASAPRMVTGGKPVEFGHLLLTSNERAKLVRDEPLAEKYIRPFTMGAEFINGVERWCIWLVDAPPSELRRMPIVMERVAKVREDRLKSSKAATRESADTPTLFQEIVESQSQYLAIPEVSSESRQYIPMGWLPPEMVSGNQIRMIPDASRYHFGILISQMHMAWMRLTAGRLEGRYRYSKDIVYNNFPWPENVSDAQRQRTEELAQAVLDARDAHPTSTLADLYDPLAMPPNLRKAHNELDRAVDRLYRSKPFEDDADRLSLLLRRYQALVE